MMGSSSTIRTVAVGVVASPGMKLTENAPHHVHACWLGVTPNLGRVNGYLPPAKPRTLSEVHGIHSAAAEKWCREIRADEGHDVATSYSNMQHQLQLTILSISRRGRAVENAAKTASSKEAGSVLQPAAKAWRRRTVPAAASTAAKTLSGRPPR